MTESELISYECAIELLKQLCLKKRTIIVIDGRCAAGKTSFAEAISSVTGADIVHMDDFFLPFELRGENRLSEAGGNLHYERFFDEVLSKIQSSEDIEYGVFDCSVGKITSKKVIHISKSVIIEGAYSLKQSFGKYYDISFFMDIEPEEQMSRIIKRNGKDKAEIFKTRWIPMEEKYFAAENTDSRADKVLTTDN